MDSLWFQVEASGLLEPGVFSGERTTEDSGAEPGIHRHRGLWTHEHSVSYKSSGQLV